MDYNYQDFTENNYRSLLKKAKQNYTFIHYNALDQPGNNILWRHDIDFSVHRAYRLAQIEQKEGISSTYFVHLHNQFYNTLEQDIVRLIYKIRDMGHDIGLHFDPYFYIGLLGGQQLLEPYLILEKKFIESIFNIECNVFSIHNPDTFNGGDFSSTNCAGMVNAYSQYLKDNYTYCSDSNGYWRFDRLQDVLEEAKYEKLQVLTHPGWWTLETMSPRDRISRCIDGRAASQHKRYDELLERLGRENVR